VYAAARWTRRAAATAARTAALLSSSPAGWLDAFGDIWAETAGLDADEEAGPGAEKSGGDEEKDGIDDDGDGEHDADGGASRDGGGVGNRLAGGAGGGGVGAAGGGGGGEEPPRPPLGAVTPGPLHGVDIITHLGIGGYSATLRFPSADAAARASDLARLASQSTPFTPNVNDATAAFLRRVLRDAFPARPLGRIPIKVIVAALHTEGSAVRDAALWTPAVAAAASAFAPGAVGLGVAEGSAGVYRAIRARLSFGGRPMSVLAASVEEAARMYDLLSIMRGPLAAGNAWRVVPNCGPDTAAFFRAAVDLHFGAGRGVGVSWDDARRALEDATSPVYAAARWTRRAAATAARTAALLPACPAGWLTFGDIWKGTAGLDEEGDRGPGSGDDDGEGGGGEGVEADGEGGGAAGDDRGGAARDDGDDGCGGDDDEDDGSGATRSDGDGGTAGDDGSAAARDDGGGSVEADGAGCGAGGRGGAAGGGGGWWLAEPPVKRRR
jgi:hypothetical protein